MNFGIKPFIGYLTRQAFNIFGAAAIFAAVAGASQAQGLYPELITPLQTPDVIRACTALEDRAGLAESECGTMTLADVTKRLAELTQQQEVHHGGR